MNNYSLASDSSRWWWASAVAGSVGTAAVVTLFALPVSGSPVEPVETSPHEPPVGASQQEGTFVDRPCYLTRPGWNDWDWEQPVCRTYLADRSGSSEPSGGLAVPRQNLDALP